jgi:hypothetical protein
MTTLLLDPDYRSYFDLKCNTMITVYHSQEWDVMVELGWITQYVDTLESGVIVAQMIRKSQETKNA